MDREALRAAIRVVIGAAASFLVAFIAALSSHLLTGDAESAVLVALVAWGASFGWLQRPLDRPEA